MEVTLMKKALAIIFACLSIFTIKSEYLVYKNVGDSIQLPTATEHEKEIYSTLMKYQFPMCTNPLNDVHAEEIDKPEREFLENKLRVFNDSYRVVFVPTVLYELFVIEKYTDRRLDLWAESIIEFFLKHLKDKTEISAESLDKQMKDCFSALTTTLTARDRNEIKAALANSALVFNYYGYEGDATKQYQEINRIYKNILLARLHILSQMGELHGGMNALGDIRSFEYIIHPLTVQMGRPLKTITKISKREELLSDAQKLNSKANVKKAHFVINDELGKQIIPFLEKTDSQVKLPFTGARKTLKLIRQKLSDNLRNPKRHIIISSHSLDTIEEKEEYAPTKYDPRPYWFVRKPHQAIHVRKPYYLLEALGTKKAKLLLYAALENEYASEKENNFNIYRAEKIVTINDKKHILMPLKHAYPHSFSFGLSLFAGFSGDLGATTFYLSIKRPICIALPVNKKMYHHDLEKNAHILVIPPYNTIVELVGGTGELFHARSKVPNIKHEKHISGICHKINDAIKELYVYTEKIPHIFSQLEILFKNNIKFLKSSASIPLRDEELEEELQMGTSPCLT